MILLMRKVLEFLKKSDSFGQAHLASNAHGIKYPIPEWIL
jgi:hypothetical protein